MGADKRVNFDCETWDGKDEENCYNLFKKAYHFVCHAHEGQPGEESCMSHIDGIIDILQYELKEYNYGRWIVATLHEILEEKIITYEELCDLFSEPIANHVAVLTKEDGCSHASYLNNLKAYEKASAVIEVKLADRLYNIRRLKYILHDNPGKVERYIKETEDFYIPLAKEYYPKCYGILQDEIKRIKSMLD